MKSEIVSMKRILDCVVNDGFLFQCKNMHFPVDSGGLQKIGVKGVISLSKPVHFKSSVKEASPVSPNWQP